MMNQTRAVWYWKTSLIVSGIFSQVRGIRQGRLITGHYDRLLLSEVSEVIMKVIIRPTFV
jgi:hypothetical protein